MVVMSTLRQTYKDKPTPQTLKKKIPKLYLSTFDKCRSKFFSTLSRPQLLEMFRLLCLSMGFWVSGLGPRTSGLRVWERLLRRGICVKEHIQGETSLCPALELTPKNTDNSCRVPSASDPSQLYSLCGIRGSGYEGSGFGLEGGVRDEFFSDSNLGFRVWAFKPNSLKPCASHPQNTSAY